MRPKSNLTVAAVQMKFRRSIAENAEWMASTVRRAAQSGVDVILFPECSVTGYNCDFEALRPEAVDAGLSAVARAARSHAVHVLAGCPTFTAGRWYNSLVAFDRRGRETFRYSKIQLTPRDAEFFAPGNRLAYFHIDRVPVTSIICHERRYPELVRLPVMMGAQIVFHPNAGLDLLAVSKAKRRGRDGIAIRAFENQVYYVFANSVGPQGSHLWSAGDSKIVGPDSTVLALANNRDEMVILSELDLNLAGRKYAREALVQPVFLRAQWKSMLALCRRQLSKGR